MANRDRILSAYRIAKAAVEGMGDNVPVTAMGSYNSLEEIVRDGDAGDRDVIWAEQWVHDIYCSWARQSNGTPPDGV